MSINYYVEDVQFPKLKKRFTTAWIGRVLDIERKSLGEISYIFCSDTFLLEMNKKYLNHNYYTDVITFDYEVDNKVSGDIFISIDRISENSTDFKTTFVNELQRIMIHGVLHLLGYKDKNEMDKRIMTAKEDYYLKILLDS